MLFVLFLAQACFKGSLAFSSPRKILVAGATGQTGKLVVSELLRQRITTANETVPAYTVVAFVRNEAKAREVLPTEDSNLELFMGDVTSSTDIKRACGGADAAVWCASGFSDAEPPSPLEKLKGLFGLAVAEAPKQSVDIAGIGKLTKAMTPSQKESGKHERLPKVVMLSSAGVSRPSWPLARKEALPGAADIPIVRMNPFDILNKKLEAEDLLRSSGLPYTVVRPTGLNDDWKPGRPVFSQGDVAVGRCNREDVAGVLVGCLAEPEAVGKTFEVFTLQGYPKPRELTSTLSRLRADSAPPLSEEALAAQYAVLQQLLPGEVMDPTQLEMGRTYEQVDRGQVAPRKQGAAPTSREKAVASSVQG